MGCSVEYVDSADWGDETMAEDDVDCSEVWGETIAAWRCPLDAARPIYELSVC